MTVKAASIGLGWWSHELAKSIHNSSQLIQIVSCYSRDKTKRLEFANRFGSGHHDSYEAVLADSTIDAVIISTPHSLHAEHVIQAAEAGKHVFVEKPFTLTVESARKATAACRSAGVVLAVGHNRRFSASVSRLKELQVEGVFDTLLHLEANFSAPGALAYTPDRWRANRLESPAGGIAALGIHLIDLLCYFAGSITRVSAQAKRRAVTVDMDDTTSVLFEFDSGATGYLGCMFACPYTSFLNIYGTNANAFAKVDTDKLSAQISDGQEIAIDIEPIDTLKLELEEFALSCTQGTPFRVTPEQAASNVAVMEAIALSASVGSPVDIGDDFTKAWKN